MPLTNQPKKTMLCLGDSYTIGEAVPAENRFPSQLVDMLNAKHLAFSESDIVAKTGWTTDELTEAIRHAKLEKHYDFVTLLIGVNNQYRGRDLANYKQEFSELLNTALRFANGNKQHVIVVSIPDWGVTPFAEKDKRSKLQIGEEIDAFNRTAKEVADKQGIYFIDITPHSRKAETDASLIASDGLHPSGKMYHYWAEQIAARIADLLK